MKLEWLGGIVAAAWLMTACSEREAAAPVAVPALVEAAPAKTPVPLAAAAPETPPAPIPPRPPEERHSAEPSAACLARTSDANAPRDATIHRWVDAAGVTHYSDTAPAAGVANHRVIEVHGLPPVKVEASGYDVNLPPDLEHRAVVDTLAVQRVFHEALGIDGPAGMALKIVFVGDSGTYGKLIGEPALAASAGAYVPPKHTIYIRMQRDDELAFSILRHEITHALIHEWVGNLPVPVNEGLAEYFRRYRVAGMGGAIDFGADRSALVASAPAGD
ncbi:MAG TPA: DUF4124 domain-containing protein, partial [Rhodanobacteraceae bacterium]|nr:DUF4124 domain-containing protein [Rhodanobacteraceae bacterium]